MPKATSIEKLAIVHSIADIFNRHLGPPTSDRDGAFYAVIKKCFKILGLSATAKELDLYVEAAVQIIKNESSS